MTNLRIAHAEPRPGRLAGGGFRTRGYLAVAAGAPVRLTGAVLDRMAVPVPDDDLLTPFLDRVPPRGRPGPGDGPDTGTS